MVHVKLTDFLSRLAPQAEFDMAIQMGTTVEEIIFDLTENLGDKFRNAVMDRTGKLHGGFGVVINKRLIPPSQMSTNTIHQNSNLSIIPLAGGG